MQRTIKFLEHAQIDFEKWDTCVASSSNPQPYGFSWYLNWLADQWQALVIGDYEAVLPLFIRKKFGQLYSTRPYGTQALGPYSKIPLTKDVVAALVDESNRYVKYAEYFFSPGTPMPEAFKPKLFSNFIIDTSADYEVLFKAYSSQIKRNLKKARSAKFELSEWATVQDAVQLWQNNVREKTAIPNASFNRLGKLLEFCYYQKRGVLYAVRDEYNQLCGSQFWVIYQGRSTLLLNASSDWGKDHGVSAWLIDQHIRSTAGRLHIIDFEGSSIPGLKRFYSGFGTKDEPFYMHVENQLSFPINLMKSKSTR
tara:strand:+ start:1060 stop:1989 length:930 start_codon:yes stop_codon:yes gene_type:complete